MTAQHTQTFAAEPLQEQIIPLSEEFIQKPHGSGDSAEWAKGSSP